VLLDSIGELRSIFPVADVVFVGGSISPNGGHNVLEPAAFGRCVVTGRHTENFTAIVAEMLRFGAIVQLNEEEPSSVADVLAGVFTDLLQDPGKRRALGDAALKVVAANQGATKLTVDRIEQLLQPPRRNIERISHEQAVNAPRVP
jgi:3-deoxy-D-manno-octulosonic-acid transferase